jgi:hypothetical protein
LRAALASRQLAYTRARADFTSFVQLAGRDDQGNGFDLEPLHLSWHRHVTWCWREGLHAGILAPWGHGKSAGLVVPLAAWLLGRNPNLRIKVVCSATELARDRVTAVKSLIESPAYRACFPHIRPAGKWASEEITVARQAGSLDPSLQAKGVFGKGVGKRADVMMFDDVCDQLNSAEEAQRRKVREFTGSTWMGRLVASGRALYIATPWNTDDATAHMMRRPGWCFLVQKVNEQLNRIEQEVHNARPGYPGLGA